MHIAANQNRAMPDALSRRHDYAQSDPFLAPVAAAREAGGRSLSKFNKDRRAGIFPEPCTMVGRSPRWRRSIILRAVGLGD
jgi:hypothetical protein